MLKYKKRIRQEESPSVKWFADLGDFLTTSLFVCSVYLSRNIMFPLRIHSYSRPLNRILQLETLLFRADMGLYIQTNQAKTWEPLSSGNRGGRFFVIKT
jgi:hypothetical protein